jgi:L-lactate dehydrogenase complex protein LldG
MSSSGKENILKKIRQALAHPVPVPFPQSEGNSSVYQPSKKELEIEFAENFAGLTGKFSFCIDEKELVDQLLQLTQVHRLKSVYCPEVKLQQKLSANGFEKITGTDVASCDASITSCEFLVARTGSLLLSSSTESDRTTSVYAPVHICIAYTSQLVYDIKKHCSS